MSAVQFLPVIVLTPFFGVLVDRIQAQSGAFVMNMMMGIIAALLGVFTLASTMTVELLIGLALTHGVIVSFYTPTRLALVPDLVPQRLLPSAVATSAIVFNLSRFVGPGLAGIVVAIWGLGWAYVVNALTYLPVLVSIALLRIDHASKPARSKAPYLDQLTEGLRYTRHHPTIRSAILLAFAGAFFGRGILELMPAFAAIVFTGGSNALAILMSSAGVGALVGSFIISSAYFHLRLQSLILGGCVGVGLALALFAISNNIIAGAVVVGMLALFSTFVGVGSQALVQVRVENRLRGRVMSLWTLVGMGGPAISSLVGGALVRDLGPQPMVFAYGGLCLLLALLFGRGHNIRTIVSSS